MPKLYNAKTGCCWPHVDDDRIQITSGLNGVSFSTPMDRGDPLPYEEAVALMFKMNGEDGGGWTVVMPHGKWWGR